MFLQVNTFFWAYIIIEVGFLQQTYQMILNIDWNYSCKILTSDGFPRRADIYPAVTPVPRLAVYTPNASNERPAAAAVILSQSTGSNF